MLWEVHPPPPLEQFLDTRLMQKYNELIPCICKTQSYTIHLLYELYLCMYSLFLLFSNMDGRLVKT